MPQVRVQEWGNSLAILLPQHIATQIGLEKNSLVDISVENEKLLLKPSRPSYSLDELLAGVTTDNLHQEIEISATPTFAPKHP